MLKRKRNVLTIEQRLQIIKKHEEGTSITLLATQYNVGIQTVCDMVKNKKKLIDFAASADSSKGMSNPKTMKTSTYYNLDKAMITWFNQQRAAGIPAAAGIPVSGIMCTAMAKGKVFS